MVPVLPSFSDAKPGGAAPDAWGLFPSAGEAVKVLTILGDH
jgi:hypothetical protein